MKKLWITYSWKDNQEKDVEFLAQEIFRSGIEVKLDRWILSAGKRLWEQIDNQISSSENSDAWAIFATQNSLGSEPCKEEVAYALQRALEFRGKEFPLIGIFPGPVENSLIPLAIKTRLHVSLSDPDWLERINAAVTGKSLNVAANVISPYSIQVHNRPDGKYAIEVRPRAGVWAPFFIAVPSFEKERVNPHILRGPKGKPPFGGMLTNSGEGFDPTNQWWVVFAGDEATTTMSYFCICDHLPTKFAFGVNNDQPQYLLDLPGN